MTGMTIEAPIMRFLLLLGLGFFFGLAFEEFHAQAGQARPGGVRTFPLLALAGALLYQLDPVRLLPLTAGLVVLGGWLAIYYWRRAAEPDEAGRPNVGLMVPICNVIALLIGPVALAGPAWLAIGATVAAVLLLTARERLHGLAQRIETAEFVTAGKFLLLTGIVLPLLPDTPVSDLTPLTPHGVWLAVLAVTTVSYASYLLQRYVAPREGGLWVAVLGGFYSSTVTTLVLARRAREATAEVGSAQTGIILASAVMYLRLLLIIFVFDRALAVALAPVLAGLSGLAFALAALWYWRGGRDGEGAGQGPPGNPLELGAAVTFAVLFVVISLVSTWARARYGEMGVYVVAAVVGVTDIDPFVLNLASHGAGDVSVVAGAAAVLIAIASNNVLKAAYATVFMGWRAGAVPSAALALLSAAGLGVAAWMAL
jgi:uncharacterized membrane protein (DUF4010 family)